MKEPIKKIFRSLGIYHPLQSFYRSVLSRVQRGAYRFCYAKYKGRGYTCNVCNAVYEKFANSFPVEADREAIRKYQIIAGYGSNIICPNCMSVARERLVLAMLTQLDLRNKSVLHFSPEKYIYQFLNKQASVITADLEPGFYRPIDRNIKMEDATSLKFPDGQFDLVVANHIMEHIPADRKAMEEIYRVLKPGGKAVLQIPYSETIAATLESDSINDPDLQSKLYGQKDHVRVYALPDYISRLEAAGFEVKKITYESLPHLYKFAIQEGECFMDITKPRA